MALEVCAGKIVGTGDGQSSMQTRVFDDELEQHRLRGNKTKTRNVRLPRAQPRTGDLVSQCSERAFPLPSLAHLKAGLLPYCTCVVPGTASRQPFDSTLYPSAPYGTALLSRRRPAVVGQRPPSLCEHRWTAAERLARQKHAKHFCVSQYIFQRSLIYCF